MKIANISLKSGYEAWCRDYAKEQAKTIQMVRRALKKPKLSNIFCDNRQIDKILENWEKGL